MTRPFAQLWWLAGHFDVPMERCLILLPSPTKTGLALLNTDKIEDLNKKGTWGWNGCKLLYKKAQICLRTRMPPFPHVLSLTLSVGRRSLVL
ncbi:hypothetical protein Trco_007162 [Trichoderma cornu-damae]|uniref:Uncharacterized protein n=1 Tax=Trichoderma cornu-damae TaxID=654480 RepID=A0A9P8QHN9_9HYPO|nr:hypothetical protein Trco_007162 [Trichoderma cornu-damae]